MMNVLIVDDHAIVRKGLRQILVEHGSTFRVDEASGGQEALEKIDTNSYDAVVLDITMPGRSGLDVLKDIKNRKPALHVLVLSMHPEDQYALRVMKAGASGYLMKESVPDELVKAIQKVANGGKYITSSLAEKLADFLGNDRVEKMHERLSDREFEVLTLIASGKTVKEIAEALCLSVKTVSTYRSRILEKMMMKTNAEVTHYAIKNGLVD